MLGAGQQVSRRRMDVAISSWQVLSSTVSSPERSSAGLTSVYGSSSRFHSPTGYPVDALPPSLQRRLVCLPLPSAAPPPSRADQPAGSIALCTYRAARAEGHPIGVALAAVSVAVRARFIPLD